MAEESWVPCWVFLCWVFFFSPQILKKGQQAPVSTLCSQHWWNTGICMWGLHISPPKHGHWSFLGKAIVPVSHPPISCQFHPVPIKAALAAVATLLESSIWLFPGTSHRELYIFSGIVLSFSSYNKGLSQISTNIICRSIVIWFCIKLTVLHSGSQVHGFFTSSESVRFTLFPSDRSYPSSLICPTNVHKKRMLDNGGRWSHILCHRRNMT